MCSHKYSFRKAKKNIQIWAFHSFNIFFTFTDWFQTFDILLGPHKDLSSNFAFLELWFVYLEVVLKRWNHRASVSHGHTFSLLMIIFTFLLVMHGYFNMDNLHIPNFSNVINTLFLCALVFIFALIKLQWGSQFVNRIAWTCICFHLKLITIHFFIL